MGADLLRLGVHLSLEVMCMFVSVFVSVSVSVFSLVVCAFRLLFASVSFVPCALVVSVEHYLSLVPFVCYV